MQGSQRLLFLLLVLFFAGSMVILGAQQLKQQLLHKGKGADREAARRLISDLQGEVFADKSKAPQRIVDPQSMPARERREMLQPSDRKRFQAMLRSLVSSDEPPVQEAGTK